MTPESAMRNAKIVPELRGKMGNVAAFFRASPKGGVPNTIRFACQAPGGWLFADLDGGAVYAGRKGTFDVLGFERWIRKDKSLRPLGYSPLVALTVKNDSGGAVRLSSRSGNSSIRLAPSEQKTITTWFHTHLLSRPGQPTFETDRFLRERLPWLRFERRDPPTTDKMVWRSRLRDAIPRTVRVQLTLTEND